MSLIILRKTNESDIADIYKYLHRDFVKKYSEVGEKAEWTQHRRWYKFLINSESYLLYIIEDKNGKFLGQLKFELEGETSIISIYLLNEIRGKGLAKSIIEMGLSELIHESDEVDIVLAYILEENEPSLNLFKSCGFEFEGETEYGGIDHLLYIKRLKLENES